MWTEFNQDNEPDVDNEVNEDNELNKDGEMAQQQVLISPDGGNEKSPRNKIHIPSKDEDESKDDLGGGRYMVEEFCFEEVFYGIDLCFENELDQLEEAVFSILKLSPVVEKQVLNGGKSRVRALMSDLERMWKKIDTKQQRSGEKMENISQNENIVRTMDQVPDISTEFKWKTMRKRKSDGDLVEVESKMENLQDESSLSEGEASQVFGAKLKEGMDSVKQLTMTISQLTMETRWTNVGESKEELEKKKKTRKGCFNCGENNHLARTCPKIAPKIRYWYHK